LEGKGSYFVLLIIVAILTLTLVILAGYLFFVASPQQPNLEKAASGEVELRRPSDSELASKKIFDEKQYFNLKSTQDNKLSVIAISVELVYFKKVEGIKSTEEKINANESKIKEMIGTYFQNLTIEEVKLPETKQRANIDLTRQINNFLTSNEDQKQEIVYEVVFDEWFYQ
jgi:flagellar basal body-associated protein FliL